ncbi:MAG: hypothetical protein ABI862_16025 [Ilumatobacteraceae bacterium]
MRHVRSIFAGVLIAGSLHGVVSAAPPTELAPPAPEPSTSVASDAIGPQLPTIEQPPPIVGPLVVSSPLVVLPAGCTAQPAPVAVFVGTLADADATTARFAVEQIRAGSLDGYAVDTIVDVRYDDDIRFLHPGQQYLVGARPDPITSVLHSKVRSPAPLFGGDAVIGVDDTDLTCPRVEDGVKTLLADGTEVDTGVLAPLATAKKSLLKAVLKPLGIAFAVLVVLASMKLLIFAMVRAAREREDEELVTMPPEVQRDRQHTDPPTDTDPNQIPELNSR